MQEEIEGTDISNLAELLRLAEGVQRPGQPHLLKRGDQEIAVLFPVEPQPISRGRTRRRAKPIPRTDSLFKIIGLIHTEGPADVSVHKHKYLADAYFAEAHRSTDLDGPIRRSTFSPIFMAASRSPSSGSPRKTNKER